MARLLQDGHTAFLYEPGDTTALGDALARLAADPTSAQRMGDAGRQMLLTNGTWDVVMRNTLARLGL
jgi:glycosyltransferase involved in cell wall biosynthesis